MRLSPSRPTWFLAAALLIAGAAAWPFLGQAGLLNTRGGGDSPFLLQRLHQLAAALADGHFPVRWMPDANYGYGYPFFNFYAPLSIYIAALFRFLGFSFVRAIELAQLLAFLVAAWGMFQLGRRWFDDDWASLLAAAAYTLAPFHLVNVYVRGDSLAEFWAMAFYPLVLLAADHLAHSRKIRVLWLALAYAGLILSHNISALIFTPFLLLYLLVRSNGLSFDSPAVGRRAAQIEPLMVALAALGLGLLLSAWFWLPALAERSLAQLGPVTAGYFHFGNHFRGADLVQGSFFFDYDVAGGRAFRMGLAQAAMIVLGLAACLAWPRRPAGAPGQVARSRLFYLVAGLLVATLAITPLSRPLWERLPLLSFVQFPWRFLSVQAFFGALAAAGLARLPGRPAVGTAAVALLLVTSLAQLPADHLILSDADVTAARLAEYEWFTGNIGSTVSAEYLPPTVQPRPYTSSWLANGQRDAVQALDGRLQSVRLLERQATRQQWLLASDTPSATLVLPTLYWPGWEATIDGQPAAIQPAPGSGLISLELPAGEHQVSLRLNRTPIRLAAELVSLAAVVLAGWLLWPAGARLGMFRALRRPPRRLWWPVLALALLAVGLWLWPERPRPGTDLTWDFAQMGYLSHQPAGIPFQNGVRLQSYTYDRDTVRAGESLTITLHWAGPAGGQATLALLSPAANRDLARVPTLTSQAQPLAAGPVTYRLNIPANAPAGPAVPRLILANARSLTPAGQPRGDLYLRPLLILDAPQEAAGNSPALAARTVEVTQPAANTLEVQLQWLTLEPLSRNYNVSLRLADANGLEVAQFDTQPGYGFQPSSGWRAGYWVDDWLALPLPATLAGEAPYALVARLYDVETGTVALIRRLGELTWQGPALAFRPTQPGFTLPEGVTPLAATFGAMIQLRGYTLDQAEEDLHLTLYWQALAPIPADYSHFVHLVDPATGVIVAQHDSMPRQNSYPTSQWAAGEIVADSLSLDLTGAPAGQYELVAGLYQNLGDSFPRLPAVDGQGRPWPNGRVLLVASLTIR